jgi:protocatechuate 3,4-dioxygenase beta subunit
VSKSNSVAVCLIAALLTSGLFGQDRRSNGDAGVRSVQGVVTDSSGNPVDKAVVQLKDTKSLQIRSFITNPDGSYHFAGLSPNVEYQLKAEHQGVFSARKTLSVFSSKKSVTINLKLKKMTDTHPAPSP